MVWPILLNSRVLFYNIGSWLLINLKSSLFITLFREQSPIRRPKVINMKKIETHGVNINFIHCLFTGLNQGHIPSLHQLGEMQISSLKLDGIFELWWGCMCSQAELFEFVSYWKHDESMRALMNNIKGVCALMLEWLDEDACIFTLILTRKYVLSSHLEGVHILTFELCENVCVPHLTLDFVVTNKGYVWICIPFNNLETEWKSRP